MNVYRTINKAWVAASALRERRFRLALKDPAREQGRILERCLASNASSAFGRQCRFSRIDGIERYRSEVPLSTYDDYVPWVERIRRGDPRVLTHEPVRRLVPSSGSTAACKLIPYTRRLQGEFNRAVGAWIVDMFRRHPDASNGPAYWSISPAQRASPDPTSCVPVGFDNDSAYLGGFLAKLIDRLLPVPGSVRLIDEIDTLRYCQLLFLLKAAELSVISVWHPSFLTLLLQPLPLFWEQLLVDVEQGTLTPPGRLNRRLRIKLQRDLRPEPGRARELRTVDPAAWTSIWPHLRIVSCWGDGPAEDASSTLEDRLRGVAIERKGLIATEAIVSIPYDEGTPLAIGSHFFEFLDDRERAHLAHELRRGAEYSVVVTTGGGLYRYRLGDRIRVDGFVGRTPTVRFVGRDDRVSDRFGEKLSDANVSGVLDRLLGPLDLGVSFAMLAPDEHEDGTGYTLYLESRNLPPPGLDGRCDRLLSENRNYEYCRRLGQLAPVRLFRVSSGADEVYLERSRRSGGRLGEVKPTALSPESGWSELFPGGWIDGAGRPAGLSAGHPAVRGQHRPA